MRSAAVVRDAYTSAPRVVGAGRERVGRLVDVPEPDMRNHEQLKICYIAKDEHGEC